MKMTEKKAEEELLSGEIRGEIIHKRGIGRLVGMPTADLRPDQGTQLPGTGVYAGKILLYSEEGCGEYPGRESERYCCAVHIGPCPTMDSDKAVLVKIHILDFQREIFGSRATLRLYRKIRDVRSFDSASLLLAQIEKDCLEIRRLWGMEVPLASRLTMDASIRQAVLGDREIYLSEKEFAVLYLLWSHPDISFTKENIYETVWQEPSNQSCHAVENTVYQIRKKLRPFTCGHETIKTITGFGYKYSGS